MAAIVMDDYDAALQALCTTEATVLVVAHADRLDETCTPRMEIAASAPVAPGPRGRRTSLLRRNAAK